MAKLKSKALRQRRKPEVDNGIGVYPAGCISNDDYNKKKVHTRADVAKMIEASKPLPTTYDNIKQLEINIKQQRDEVEHRKSSYEFAKQTLTMLVEEREAAVESLRLELVSFKEKH